jgi:hypothetical protein
VNKFVVRTLVLDLSAKALTTNQANFAWQTTSPQGRGVRFKISLLRGGLNKVRLRIFVGWVEGRETQQTLQYTGFCSSTQPTYFHFLGLTELYWRWTSLGNATRMLV